MLIPNDREIVVGLCASEESPLLATEKVVLRESRKDGRLALSGDELVEDRLPVHQRVPFETLVRSRRPSSVISQTPRGEFFFTSPRSTSRKRVNWTRLCHRNPPVSRSSRSSGVSWS